MSQSRSVLITGASGLLGRGLMEAFQGSTFWQSVSGTAFSRSGANLVKLDLTDFEAVESYIVKTRPDILVHAAAQRFPDKMEKDPESSLKLNVEATRELSEAVNSVGGRLLYISTDYVFDGKNPPYHSDSETNPLNFYGKSKLDGEKIVLEANPNNMVLRIPILYGDVEYLDESAVTTLFKLLKSPPEKETNVSDYEIRRPSNVKDIAAIAYSLCRAAFEKDDETTRGIFQWCGKEPLTKFGMVKAMAEVFDLELKNLVGDDKPSTGVPRPYDTTMCTKRLQSLGIDVHTTFKTGIKECLQKWS